MSLFKVFGSSASRLKPITNLNGKRILERDVQHFFERPICSTANVFVYINNPPSLSVSDGSDFKDWIIKFFSPHNWLMLATILLTLNGLRSIWLMCEQKWPIIKDFRFIPVVAVICAMLIFIGATF